MNRQEIKKIANEILSRKIIPLEDLFDSPIAKIALSAGELIFRTNRRSIKYAKGCVATSKRNDPKNGRWTFTVRCNQTWSKGPYDVRFRLLKSKGKKTQGILGREIEVSCNCNAWKYNGADFNALDKDYSERQYSDGRPPNTRDPQRKYLICKHIAACIPLFKRFVIPEGFEEPVPPRPGTPIPTPQKKKQLPRPQIKKKPVVPELTPEKPETRQPKKPTRIKPITLR